MCRYRKEFPAQYFFFAVAGLCAAVVLSMFFKWDGHGRGLLIGAVIASVLPARRLAIAR